jgi:hypothetical protein
LVTSGTVRRATDAPRRPRSERFANAHAYQALSAATSHQPVRRAGARTVEHCRETLADHELQIAWYYVTTRTRRRPNPSARPGNRFNDTDVAGDALFNSASSIARRIRPEGRPAFAALEYHHPEHEAAQKAEQELKQLSGDDPPPAGDPLAALKAETGRTRTIAIAQGVRPLQDTKQQAHRGGPPQTGTGFGLPQSSGPFGQRGTGPYGGRY